MPEQADLSLVFNRSYLLDTFPSEADARGELFRLMSLARAREADGLEPSDAELEAAQSLGLDLSLKQLLEEIFEPLLTIDFEAGAGFDFDKSLPIPLWWEGGECLVKVKDTRGNLPTLRRTQQGFILWLPAAPFDELASLSTSLVRCFVEEPERAVATVELGLGGSGGCACGDELPEETLAGPLFSSALGRSRFTGN